MKKWVRCISLLLFFVSAMNYVCFAQNEIEESGVGVQETITPEQIESADDLSSLQETSDEVLSEEMQELPDATEDIIEIVQDESATDNEPQIVSDESEDQEQANDEMVQEAVSSDEEKTDQMEDEEDSLQEEDEIVGIDTIDLSEPQGNWLFKRHWWERAEKKYEKIREQVARILEARMSFFQKRSKIDRNLLDPFYLQIGLDQASLEYVIAELLGNIEKQREQDGTLEDYEREWLNQLVENQSTLEQIKLNAQAINKVDHDVDDALEKLMQQVNRAREYEREAWNYFKEIARVLNDKRARELVMRMKNISRNVKQLYTYLQAQFTPYYHNLIKTIQDKTNQIKLDVDLLKENGVDLKQQMDQINNKEREPEPEVQEREPIKLKAEPGFLSRYIFTPIANVLTFVWNGIVAVVRFPINLIFGEKKGVPVQESEMQETIAITDSENEQEE